MSLGARISCATCAFRHGDGPNTLRELQQMPAPEIALTALLDTPAPTAADTKPGVTPPPRRRALAGLALSTLLASLGTSGANVALPTFARVFDASFESVQWVVLAYLIAVTTLIVVAGRLGDFVGRKRLLGSGVALFTAAALACGLAPSLGALVAGRVAQGLGAAIMISLSIASVADAVALSRVGRAMGLLGTMSAVGTALGPSLGGFLLAGPGWRSLFIVNVPLGVAAWWLALALPERPRQEATSLPLLPPSLFTNRDLGASLISNALVACVMMSTLIVGPFYLTRALALAPAAMGLVMTVGPVLTALTGLPAGRLVDAHGAYRVTLAGLASMAAGGVLLAVVPASTGIAGYVAPIALLTMGYAVFQAGNNTAVVGSASSDERGVIAGVLSLSRNLGLIAGASLMGAVFAWTTGASSITTALPEAVARGMHATFGLAVVLVGIAFTLITTRNRAR
jgi:MFS family permease